jgi:glucokinase
MATLLAGVDIGGTKCAVSVGEAEGEPPRVLGRRAFPTPPTPDESLARIVAELRGLCAELGAAPAAVGVSCGGPLDSASGLVLAPPNLPGWDAVDVLAPLGAALGAPAAIQNDANACALAEWRWGAGRGLRHVVFLTFGTGMGAGLILDGRLYSGANDMAGEVGHVRLADHGPVGCGKLGSFEGFCSGAGIARLARAHVEAELQLGRRPALCPRAEDLPALSAAAVAAAARAGDPLALRVFETVAVKLGQGLAILIDVLNPEAVVIGSIFGRQRELIEPLMRRVLAEECLPRSLAVCRVVPAGLGEQVGDYAALAVAREALGAAGA